jgi:hypothetical protein
VLPSNWPAEIARESSVVWNQMQEEEKDLSVQSRRIIAKGSDHYVQIDRADLVNREVTAFLTHIRKHEFPAEEDHVTIEE